MSDSYTPRMCRASDRSYIDAFREGQKLERELEREVAEHSKVQAEAARLHCTIDQMADRQLEIAQDNESLRAESARLRSAIANFRDVKGRHNTKIACERLLAVIEPKPETLAAVKEVAK